MTKRAKIWTVVGVILSASAGFGIFAVVEQRRASTERVRRDMGGVVDTSKTDSPPVVVAARSEPERTRAEAFPTPEEVQAEEDKWVVDWQPSDAPPRVIWTKEDDGWTAKLDEAGVIMIDKETGQDSKETPEEIAQSLALRRLNTEAKVVRRQLLRMIPRAEWEARERAKAVAAADVMAVKPEQFGFKTIDDMKAAYRSRFDVPEGEDFDLVMRKNDQGTFELNVVVSTTGPVARR